MEMRERKGTSSPVREKCAKTHKHEMIQQDGELRKPSGEAEVLSTEGTCAWRLAQRSRPSQEGLESHTHPTGLSLQVKNLISGVHMPHNPPSFVLPPSPVR